MVKPKVLVFSGYGLNCEEETKVAFELSGANAEIVHINDLIDGGRKLDEFQILAFPGGFSYGDDTGSGNAYANRLRNHLYEEILEFIKKDKLVIGLCNGFQIMVNFGLLPAIDGKFGERQVALLHNDNARYTNRWVDLKVEGMKTPWLKDIKTFPTPLAHGEGKFYAEQNVLEKLQKNGQIVLKYFKGEICEYQNLTPNPNGSLEDVAGLTDESGKIFGMMPHPERGMLFTQLPNWTYLKEKLKREGKDLPTLAPGIKIYQNGVEYFK
jgi:phosphoribosylformylglycinamidine synthase subunit PurQ / glutaminase